MSGISAIGVGATVTVTADQPAADVCGCLLFAAASLFVLPLMLGTGAAIDRTGRLSGILGGVYVLGAAQGPAVGGMVSAGEQYGDLLWLVVASIACALVLVYRIAGLAAIVSQRQQPD